MDKKEPDYQSAFLKRSAPCTRSHAVYINERNYNRMKRIITTLGQIPSTEYVENILNHHFEIYEEEIIKLLRKKDEEIRKFLKQ